MKICFFKFSSTINLSSENLFTWDVADDARIVRSKATTSMFFSVLVVRRLTD